jgi:hypothetical protein
MDAIIASQADIYYQLADNPPPNMSWHDLKALIHQGNSTKLSDAEVVYPLPVPPHVAGKGIPKSWPRPYLTRGELKLLSVPRLSMILAEYGLVTGGDRRLRRNRLAHYIGLGSL